jgi:hypothetical protein
MLTQEKTRSKLDQSIAKMIVGISLLFILIQFLIAGFNFLFRGLLNKTAHQN